MSSITEAKIDALKTSADGREFTLDNAESLLKGLINGKIDGREFRKR